MLILGQSRVLVLDRVNPNTVRVSMCSTVPQVFNIGYNVVYDTLDLLTI